MSRYTDNHGSKIPPAPEARGWGGLRQAVMSNIVRADAVSGSAMSGGPRERDENVTLPLRRGAAGNVEVKRAGRDAAGAWICTRARSQMHTRSYLFPMRLVPSGP